MHKEFVLFRKIKIKEGFFTPPRKYAFNGTGNFRNNNLLTYLQNNGVKFGTNIIAFTYFDQTVYYLTDVPTQGKKLFNSCLLLLHDYHGSIYGWIPAKRGF